MKILFGTKLRYFWVLIPMIGLLSLSISFNGSSDNLLKLYPLIVFLSGCIIFTVVFLFRSVGLAFDEVRTIGLFSSRERVMINEGKTLTLTLLPNRKLAVELFGNDGVLAELDWLRGNEDGTIPDINLFRAKAIGGMRTLIKVLKFYGLSHEDAEALVNEGTPYEDELISVSASSNESEQRQISIKFIATV